MVLIWLRMVGMVCDGFAYVRMVCGGYGLAENAEND